METRVLDGRYRLDSVLGKGGMATVYTAHDIKNGGTVAVKVLDPELRRALSATRFFREIAVMRDLSHPNLVPLLDAGESDGSLYYVMPLVKGRSLRERLAVEKQLDIGTALSVATQLSSALEYVHSHSVLHRDIKPENVLLNGDTALLADFGIAKAQNEANETLTATGMSIGTPAYMSPEQASGERQLDARSEVYSLACVIFEMIAGEPPFPGNSTQAIIAKRMVIDAPSVRVLRPTVPLAVERALQRALCRVPADRFASVGDFARALNAGAGSEPPAAIRGFRKFVRIEAAGIGLAILAVAGVAFRDSLRSRGTVRPIEQPAEHSTGSRDSLANEYARRAEAQLSRRSAIAVARGLQLYQMAIARDSDFAVAWAGLARTALFANAWAYRIPGLSRDSLMTLMVVGTERAIEADSNLSVAWVARSQMLRITDATKSSPSLMAAQRAVTLDSMSAEAWYSVGAGWLDSLELSRATSAFRRAVELNPRHVNALTFLGIVHNLRHQYDSALIWVDSAERVDATHIFPHQTMVCTRMFLGQWSLAQSESETILRLGHGSDQTVGWSGLAILEWRRGNRAAADSLLRRAIASADTLHPSQHDAVNLAWGLSEMGQARRAVKLLARHSPRGGKHYQMHLLHDPLLDSIRRRPEFQALLINQ